MLSHSNSSEKNEEMKILLSKKSTKKCSSSKILKNLIRVSIPLNVAMTTASLVSEYTNRYHTSYQVGCDQAKSDVLSGEYLLSNRGSYDLYWPIFEGLTVGTLSNTIVYSASHGFANSTSFRNKAFYSVLLLTSMGVNMIEFLGMWHVYANSDGYWRGYETCWQSYCAKYGWRGFQCEYVSIIPTANDHTNASMGNYLGYVPLPAKGIISAALSFLVAGKGLYDGFRAKKKEQKEVTSQQSVKPVNLSIN